MAAKVFVGVLRATFMVPGARTLKDRRQPLRSIQDRVRSRFEVSVHALRGSEHPGFQDLVMTTAGSDGSVVRQVMDSLRGYLEQDPRAIVTEVDVEVFPWHPPGASWEMDREDLDG